MTKEVKKLLTDALSLSESDRALLAASLIDSLENGSDPEAETEWDAEILRRLDEIDTGKVKMTPWTEARKKILESLG